MENLKGEQAIEINVQNRKDILKVLLNDNIGNKILDEEGNQVYWEFDLADIEIPMKIARIDDEYHKAYKTSQAKIIAIEKKKLEKDKERAEISKVLSKFYEEMADVLNLIIGKDGVKKFLDGRGYYLEMFDDILGAVEQIMPTIEKAQGNITERIKTKYEMKEDNVLK